jgi:hypothetical protein
VSCYQEKYPGVVALKTLQNYQKKNKYLMCSHLSDTNQKYFNHLKFAIAAGIILIFAGFASILHAIVPNIFVGYAERKISTLSRLARIRYNARKK